MKYRALKAGEIVQKGDEYMSYHTPGVFGPVQECTIGQALLECNTPYYRRPVTS